MIEQKPSSIGEAPSLDDISASDEDRVGRVDFSTKLGADDQGEGGSDRAAVSLTGQPEAAPAAAVTSEDDADSSHDDAPRSPLILPPAKVDEAMAAEAARIRREIAEARGEAVVDEVDDDTAVSDEVEEDEATSQADAETVGEADAETVGEVAAEADDEVADQVPDEVEAPAETATAAVETGEPAASSRPRFLRTKTPPPAPAVEPEPEAPPASERLQIQDVASLTEIAEQVAEAEAAAELAAARVEERAQALREESEAAAEFEAASAASLAAGPIEDIDDLLDDEAEDDFVMPDPDHVAEDDVAVDQTVADVAASVIAAMQSIGEASERHLESIELEAARRCELLTAQAELDAELIRLHARREAHAIISAARMRAGDDLTPVETDQLSEIGETFSRFAETIETTIASGPASPDTTRKS